MRDRRAQWLVLCLSVAAFAQPASQPAGGQRPPARGPVAAAASRDGKTLYVACQEAAELAVVDADGSVRKLVALPAPPSGLVLSPDGAKLYVTCAAPQSTVVVLDAASAEVAGKLAAGHSATGAAVSPDGSRLYVCNRFDHDVSVIDLAAGKELSRIRLRREPVAAGVTPDGKTLFVANHLPTDRADSYDVALTVAAIDAQSGQVAEIRLPNGSTSARGLCVSPDGRTVYVTHLLARYHLPTTQLDRGWMMTNALTVIDAQAKSLVNTVLLDDVDLGAANPWGVAVSADGAQVFVAHAGTNELSVIQAKGLLDKLAAAGKAPPAPAVNAPDPTVAPHSTSGVEVPDDLSFLVGLRQRIKLPGKGARGVALAGGKAYVTAFYSDALSRVDLREADRPRVDAVALGPVQELTAARRGEMLFNDAEICFQHWQSCASCHPDGRADALNWDLMNDGLGNPKNTRSLLRAPQTPPSMALGVRTSAQVAVRAGITHILFAVRPEEEAAAIDAYLEAMAPVPSPRLMAGELNPAARAGRELFEDPGIGCAKCHPGPLYTDLKQHEEPVAGGGRMTLDTPTLIESWRTAPYGYNGHYQSVREMLEAGRHGLPKGDAGKLTPEQLAALAEFVESL